MSRTSAAIQCHLLECQVLLGRYQQLVSEQQDKISETVSEAAIAMTTPPIVSLWLATVTIVLIVVKILNIDFNEQNYKKSSLTLQ